MTWCCDSSRSRIAREVAMDAKTPTSAAMATATSSHLVRGERLPFDCSVMKACSGSEERRSIHQFYWMLGDRRRHVDPLRWRLVLFLRRANRDPATDGTHIVRVR